MRLPLLAVPLDLATGVAVAADPVDPYCGLGPDDWCPAPEGDPCGRHPDEASCRADPACYAMPYRGEFAGALRLGRARLCAQLPRRRLHLDAAGRK